MRVILKLNEMYETNKSREQLLIDKGFQHNNGKLLGNIKTTYDITREEWMVEQII